MKTKRDNRNVGIAVVGLGRGMAHVKCASKVKNGELLAVCDINGDKARAAAEQYGVDAYTDFTELLKRDDIDLINICTPSGLHTKMAIQAAEAGKNVLSEKPLDIKIESIDNAVRVFEEKKLKLGCIFQNRFSPANRKMKEAAESGRLGRLILATAHIKWYRDDAYYKANGGWRGTWAMDGGGSLMNQSVHTIDLMQWIMGPVKSVVGVTKIWSHNIETEDMGVALVKFENGALGTIAGSTAAYPGFGTSLEVHGVDGGICMKNNHITSWKIKGQSSDEEEKMIQEFGESSGSNAIENDTTLYQIQDMVDAVKYDRQPQVPGSEGRKAVEIILAIYESSKTGSEVFLPL